MARLTAPGRYLGNSFQTDGFQLHVSIRCVSANPFLNAVKDDDQNDDDMSAAGADSETMQDDPRPYYNRHVTTRDMAAFVRGVPGIYSFWDISRSPAAVAALAACQNVVAGDPGKVNVLTVAFQQFPGVFRKLTQKNYYAQSRWVAREADNVFFRGTGGDRRWRRRHIHGYTPRYFQQASRDLLSLSTSCLSTFEAALRQRAEVMVVPMDHQHGWYAPAGAATRGDWLWRYQLSRRVAERRFVNYGRRRRLLDQFLSKLVGAQAGTIMLFGDGFDGSSLQKCRMPSPVRKLLRAAGTRMRVIMVPEFRTTKNCSNAVCQAGPHEATVQVFRRVTVTIPATVVTPGSSVALAGDSAGSGSTATVRTTWKATGSRWCPKCKQVISRDGSAATNILTCGVSRMQQGRVPESLRWRPQELSFLQHDPWHIVNHSR